MDGKPPQKMSPHATEIADPSYTSGSANPILNMKSTSRSPSREHRAVGFHEAETLSGRYMVDNVEKLEAMHPSLGRNIIETGFGSTLAQAAFGYRDWALHTVGVLAAMGDCADQIDVYLESALRHGATADEVHTIINHTASFAGAPRAVTAMRKIKSRLEAAEKFPGVYIRETLVRLHDHETLVRDTGGSGVPILLIHALSMDGRMFRELIPILAQKGHRVIAYDMRGHGYARGAPLTKSLEHLAADLNELLQILEIDQIDAVGASYGGAVAQAFVLNYPSRVRSVVPMATSAASVPALITRATRAENGEMAALRTEAIIRWFRPETIADNTWCVRYARAQVEKVDIREWAAAWRAMAALNYIGRMHEIKCPMLVLAGEKDLSATPEIMLKMHEAAKASGGDSRYVVIDNCTHMCSMEDPETTAQALLAFRKEVGG